MAIHIAGKPEGLIQQCMRCDYLLQDYRNTMSVEGEPICFWAEGALVEVREGNPRVMTLVGEGPTHDFCEQTSFVFKAN